MPKKKLDIIKKLAAQKNAYIAAQLALLEDLVQQSAIILNDMLLSDFLSRLSTDSGDLVNDSTNVSKVSLIEQVLNRFQSTQGVQIITAFVQDLREITELGKGYYVELIDNKIPTADIDKILNQKLGLEWKGDKWTPTPKGYINNLIADTTIRTEIKQIAYNNIIAKSGYNSLKNSLENYIVGTEEGTTGQYYGFYKQYAFDTYSEVDRLNSSLHADKLNLRYFLYNGGVVDNSREFCIERHGKCFSTKEAEKWKDLIGKYEMRPGKSKKLVKVPIGPIGVEKETYEPLLQLGGIFCRHSTDYISDELAKQLRSDI